MDTFETKINQFQSEVSLLSKEIADIKNHFSMMNENRR
jgi:hypothetical protein